MDGARNSVVSSGGEKGEISPCGQVSDRMNSHFGFVVSHPFAGKSEWMGARNSVVCQAVKARCPAASL